MPRGKADFGAGAGYYIGTEIILFLLYGDRKNLIDVYRGQKKCYFLFHGFEAKNRNDRRAI